MVNGSSIKFVDVAFVADRNMEPGLHTAVYSALSHLGQNYGLRIHLFLAGFDDRAISSLKRTASQFAHVKFDHYEIDVKAFTRARGLHSNSMSFQLLLIPSRVRAVRVIFLDCDTVVLYDLAHLAEIEMPRALGAVTHETVGNTWSKERTLMRSVGIDDDLPYYNTGVVIIDIRKWIENDIDSLWRKFVKKHGEKLVTADQSVVNASLQEHTFALDAPWNTFWYPSHCLDEAEIKSAKIIHLLGSPKPWDLFGDKWHGASEFFLEFLEKTDIGGYRGIRREMASYIRGARLCRMYWKLFRNRRRGLEQ